MSSLPRLINIRLRLDSQSDKVPHDLARRSVRHGVFPLPISSAEAPRMSDMRHVRSPLRVHGRAWRQLTVRGRRTSFPRASSRCYC